MRLRLLLSVILLLALIPAARARDAAQTALHLLDYIAVDYAEAVENGTVKNADEYQEMREFTGQVQGLIQGLPENEARSRLLSDASALAARIGAKAEVREVAAKATALRWAVIRAYDLQIAPKTAPDLKRGATLYAEHCAACHGAEGRGDGAAGKGLDPAPSDFHDAGRMASRSVYGLYNTITLGVDGTGMASYRRLSEEDRWALAFYVANFGATDETRAEGRALWAGGKGRDSFPDLANVATLSANEIKERFGEDGVALQAYLRANPAAVVATKPSPLEFAIATLARSLDAYRVGARAEAARLAIQAYLEGFELIESGLQNVDPGLMARTEREMMAYRGLLQSGAPLEQVEKQAAAVQALLADVREVLGGAQLSWATTFGAALVILLREGTEAILVVAAILAFLTRAGRTEARRWVHAGWIAALALGLLTWAVSNYVVEISGAGREVTEGVTALIAAAMLLYVGYWLHSKSHSAAWQRFIRDKVSGALSTGTVWTLAVVSFLAVYREAFETVLFYQALSAQAGPEGYGALLAGLGLAAVLLVAVAWAILRASVKLPIGLFFSASGIVLLILAVIFTGQGIAALQEAGKIGADAVRFITVPMLGVYPTLQTLSAQALAIILSAFGLWWATRKGRPVSDDTREK
ncbi:iron permease [Sulfurifustis variabilis]|uniref:Iron permease n=1 Tax=Sulfurifustis variabilis TaxID=1675686 RepID=A0A1B4V845_9GAMM|nr:cytochrome c/FTR1 family iron permease [Sulfurifustis variabilis]BAU49675.1 iron permease [Sulfurifustis variabilis]